jgi:YD repeat-containing protein
VRLRPRRSAGIASACAVTLLLPVLALANRPEDASQSPRPSQHLLRSAEAHHGKEIVRLRTATSRTFAYPDGSRRAVIAAEPIHYKGMDGNYHAIDNTLVAAGAHGRVVNRANAYTAYLPLRLTEAIAVRIAGARIAFRLVGAGGHRATDGAHAEYRNALADTDIKLSAEPLGLKEEIVLRSADAPSKFVYDVAVPNGVTASLLGDGSVAFRRNGVRIATMPAAFMEDASGARSTAVSTRLRRRSRRYELTLVPNRAWLNDARRQFPVVVDPTVFIKPPAADCYIANGNLASRSFCTTTDIKVGYDGTRIHRGLLRFDLASVPAEAEVYSAKVSMWTTQVPTIAPALELREVRSSWTSAVTWSTADGSRAWPAGGDIGATALGRDPSVSTSIGLTTMFPAEVLQAWVDGSRPSHGLLIKARSESVRELTAFKASESGSPPELSVDYGYRAGEPPRTEHHFIEDLPRDLQVGVDLTSGNLHVRETALEHSGTDFDYDLELLYNSRSSGWWMGRLGRAANFNMIEQDRPALAAADGSITIRDHTGARLPYIRRNDGSYLPPLNIDRKLEQRADGTHLLTDLETGEQFVYNTLGRLAEQREDSGNVLSYHYNSAGTKLLALTDSLGRRVDLVYTGDYPTSIVSSVAGTWNITYDGSTRPKTVERPGRSTTYTYSTTTAQLVRIESSGVPAIDFGYDSSNRIQSVRHGLDPVTGARLTTTFTYAAGSTTVRDPQGVAHRYDVSRHVQVFAPDATPPETNLFEGAVEDDGEADEIVDGGRGPLALTYVATDQRSGVRSTRLTSPAGATLVNRSNTCGSACPRTVRAAVTVDGLTLPQGANTYTATAVDAAGNQRTDSHRILIDRTPPSAPTRIAVESYDAAAAQLTIGWDPGADPDLPGAEPGSGPSLSRSRYRRGTAWSPWLESADDIVGIAGVPLGESISVEVATIDAAGNVGPIAAATVTAVAPATQSEEYGVLPAGNAALELTATMYGEDAAGEPAAVGRAAAFPMTVTAANGSRATRLTDQDGVAHFASIAAGTYTVSSDGAPDAASRTVAVASGSTARDGMPVAFAAYTVTDEERAFCNVATNAYFCLFARGAAMKAEGYANRLYTQPEIGSDGTKANAFKHAYWVALMVIAIARTPLLADDTFWKAREMARRHEARTLESPKLVDRRLSAMDLSNNNVGYNLAVREAAGDEPPDHYLCARVRTRVLMGRRIRFRPRSSIFRRPLYGRIGWYRRLHPQTKQRVSTWPRTHFANGIPCYKGPQGRYDDSGS